MAVQKKVSLAAAGVFMKKIQTSSRRVQKAASDLAHADAVRTIITKLEDLLLLLQGPVVSTYTHMELNAYRNVVSEARQQLSQIKVSKLGTVASLKCNAYDKARELLKAVGVLDKRSREAAKKSSTWHSDSSHDSSVCNDDSDSDEIIPVSQRPCARTPVVPDFKSINHNDESSIVSNVSTKVQPDLNPRPYSITSLKYLPWSPAMKSQMAALGFARYPIGGDGNCLFRAFSHQLYGYSDDHFSLRQQICTYMEEHSDQFYEFIKEGDFSRYMSSMRHAGKYGDEYCIMAFARLYGVCVSVHQVGRPILQYNHGQKEINIVFNKAYKHYDSVV